MSDPLAETVRLRVENETLRAAEQQWRDAWASAARQRDAAKADLAEADALIGKYDQLRLTQSAEISRLTNQMARVRVVADAISEIDGIGSEAIRYWASRISEAAGETK